MRKRVLLLVFCLLVCALGAAAFTKRFEIAEYLPVILKPDAFKQATKETKISANPSLKNETNSPETNIVLNNVQASKPNAIPTQVTYLFLFKRVAALEKQATDAAAKGEDASRYFRHYKEEAKINDGQFDSLLQISKNCIAETAQKDNEAKRIIDAARAKFPKGNIDNTAPPPELAVLQQQRDLTVLRWRDRLEASLGSDAFNKFEQFVNKDITAQITGDFMNRARPQVPVGAPRPRIVPNTEPQKEQK